ncbi:MAG: DUF4199 domain-containing protein [Candidatus Ryanbacteria bacterium]|nr:DUF4199 domain-containing protein [Candidatus Ryanbacteria bacterium]
MIAIADDIRIELKFGLLAGGLVCLYMLVEFLLGFHTTRLDIGMYSGYGASIIPFIVYFFALRQWRLDRGGGFLTMRQGIRSGLLMSMIVAAMLASFMLMYNQFINPSFLDRNIEVVRVALEQQGKPVGEIRDTLDYLRATNSFPQQTIFILAGVAFEGVLISAILAYFLQKRPPVLDEV